MFEKEGVYMCVRKGYVFEKEGCVFEKEGLCV